MKKNLTKVMAMGMVLSPRGNFRNRKHIYRNNHGRSTGSSFHQPER